MTQKPLDALMHSRKFLVGLLDAIISTLAIVLAWWLAPEKLADVMGIVGIWAGLGAVVIYCIAKEDVAAIEAGIHPNQTPVVTSNPSQITIGGIKYVPLEEEVANPENSPVANQKLRG